MVNFLVVMVAFVLVTTIPVMICFFTHKCPPCQNECCRNPKKVDPAAGCQIASDEEPPRHDCCGHGPYKG